MGRIIPRIAIATAAVVAATALGGWTASAAQSHETKGGWGHDSTVTIYLTRHGQTILNALERVQGWTDAPLVVGKNADGSTLDARILPQTVGKNLRAREGKIDAAYSADMKRHYETAQNILKGAKESSLTITQDARLRELNFGKFEGAPNKEMWTAIVEQLGYQVDENASPTAPADANGQNGGWQTMQLKALADKGMPAMMTAMKQVAQAPAENGVSLPAEDCNDVSPRMKAALNDIAKKAVRERDDKVLVVSSGLSITCLLLSMGTPVTGPISNVAVSKLQYTKGTWTVKSVGDTSFGK